MTAPTNAQEYGWNPTGAAWAIQNLGGIMNSLKMKIT